MLTTARQGELRTATRHLPDSPYSVVCVAFDRGYLDDPPTEAGLAHLFEHLWFLHSPAALTLEWGETFEDVILLYHLCPPDELGPVLAAVAQRLADCLDGPAAPAQRIAAARSLITLERRGGRELRMSGFPRREIAQALRGEPGFDPTAVISDEPGLADRVTRFAAGRPRAVCVAGPDVRLSADDLLRTLAGPADRREGSRSAGPGHLLPRTFAGAAVRGAVPGIHDGVPGVPSEVSRPVRPEGSSTCATAWIVPGSPGNAAAAWLLGVLIEHRARPGTLRWASGQVVSPRGAAPVRGGLLYAVAAGTAPAGPADDPPDLQREVLHPALDTGPAELDAAREQLLRLRPDAAELAAIDAVALLGAAPAAPSCGYQDLLNAVRSAKADDLRRFAALLAASPYAEFHAGPAR